eukprot:s875_g8.t1
MARPGTARWSSLVSKNWTNWLLTRVDSRPMFWMHNGRFFEVCSSEMPLALSPRNLVFEGIPLKLLEQQRP